MKTAIALTGLGLLLAGCAQDQLRAPGTWTPTGANERNLRAMIADPQDLWRGQASATSRGAAGAMPVAVMLDGKPRKLGAVHTSSAAGSEGGGGDAASGQP